MSSFNPFSKKDPEASKSEVVSTKKEDDKKPDAKKDDEEQPANAAEPDKEEDKNQVCQMKRGDYMIHVMIE